MIDLVKYSPEWESETAKRISDFFGFHSSLVGVDDAFDYSAALEILREWQTGDSELYVLCLDGGSVGFLRLRYRGPIVAWIEDIYIDPICRGKGMATEAIHLAEEIVRAKPGYTAVCFDVVTRNSEAISLYHKLGYTDLSIITLRKELGESKRDRKVELFGKEFKY